jgi:hypothetical protein
MIKSILGSLMLFIVFVTEGQSLNPKNYYFGWEPNPTEFIRKNHGSFLSDTEYKELLSCAALFFDVRIDLRKGTIVSAKYSKSSAQYNQGAKSPDLSGELAVKLEKILISNIRTTQVRSLDGKEIPDAVLEFSLSLDFSLSDKQEAKVKN